MCLCQHRPCCVAMHAVRERESDGTQRFRPLFVRRWNLWRLLDHTARHEASPSWEVAVCGEAQVDVCVWAAAAEAPEGGQLPGGEWRFELDAGGLQRREREGADERSALVHHTWAGAEKGDANTTNVGKKVWKKKKCMAR